MSQRNRANTTQTGAPTSADVARLAGVSPATISLVLNGRASNVRISDETRDRVISAAARLGYTPNHAARSLRQRSTKTITFVLPTLGNPYFAEVVAGAQAAASKHGYAVTVIPTDGSSSLSPLQGAAYDGVIVAGRGSCTAADLMQLTRRGVAVVVMQERSPDPAIQSVRVDLETGGYMATRHLIELGHRRIAHVTESLPDNLSQLDRLDGYRRALQEAGMPFDPSLVVTTDNSMAGGAQAIERLLDSGGERPTAAFMYNDLMAVGALHVLRKRRIGVPKGFAVVGFDGVSMGQFTAPPLTTIDHPREELGRLAIETLIDTIEGKPSETKQLLLPVTLVVRESCGAGSRAFGAGTTNPKGMKPAPALKKAGRSNRSHPNT